MIIITAGTILLSCSSSKRNIFSRTYHNITARYNALYNSKVIFGETVKQIGKNYVYDFTKYVPIYLTTDANSVKSVLQPLDNVIKKASYLIQRHRNSRWVDDAYLLIAKCRFYKNDFSAAEDALSFVLTKFEKTDLKKDCYFWLIHSKMKNEDYTGAKKILDLAFSETDSSEKIFPEFLCLHALYLIHENYLETAITNLESSLKMKPHNKNEERIKFLIAQLYEKLDNKQLAFFWYSSLLKDNPVYEVAFEAKIHMARSFTLDESGKEQSIMKYLKKMAKDDKNFEYLDRIYYEMGNVQYLIGERDKAMELYQESLKRNKNHPYQKALSYNKLAEIYFLDLKSFKTAQLYYDSAATQITTASPEYALIQSRKENLSDFVRFTDNIHAQDSLLHLSTMKPEEIDSVVDVVIKRIISELEKKQQQQQNTGNQNLPDPNANTNTTNTGEWYFYNPALVVKGKNDFLLIWGNRPLTDNWRVSASQNALSNVNTTNSLLNRNYQNVSEIKREYFYKNLPRTAEEIKNAHKEILKNMYDLGNLYYQQFDMSDSAIATFNRLLALYPSTEYTLNVYYSLYNLYNAQKDLENSNNYKNIILTKYSDTRYAKIIQNIYITEKDTSVFLRDLNKKYEYVFKNYENKKYQDVITATSNMIKLYDNPTFLKKSESAMPQFYYLRAVSYGKIGSADSVINQFQYIKKRFPDCEFIPMIDAVLKRKNNESGNINSVNNKNSQKPSIFSRSLQLPDDKNMVILIYTGKKDNNKEITNIISGFNQRYYQLDNLKLISLNYNDTTSFYLISEFKDNNYAMRYLEQLKTETSLHEMIPTERQEIYYITSQNFNKVYTKKILDEYRNFYKEVYTASSEK